ncbi:MAG: TSUP family transporter, partial [Novosphingobium sp.]|nr:TSUP family transporter [Novosphingobium sp.]
VLLFSAFHMVRTARRAMALDALVKRPPVALALLLGAMLGLLAGLTGTGGGIFLSPLLLFMGWAATRKASGVAASFILVNSIAGLAGTTLSLGALPGALPVWAAAALVGGLIGERNWARARFRCRGCAMPLPWYCLLRPARCSLADRRARGDLPCAC